MELFSGDKAIFLNLGFSDNNLYYMFGQYGILDDGSKPYVDFFIVNVAENDFVDSGVLNKIYNVTLEPGTSSIGAVFRFLLESSSIIRNYDINHLNTGRILYFLVDGIEPKEYLDFRDFITGNRYIIKLIQNSYGDGRQVESSFHLDVTIIDKNNKSSNYIIGLPDYRREGVKRYRIKQILLSGDNKSLICVIEKEEVDLSGDNIRYMVETVRLKN
jgi:predicted secreted protein